MYKFVYSLFAAFVLLFIYSPITLATIGDKGAVLQHQYEIMEQNNKTFWLLQNEDQFMQIKDSEKTHDLLLQYKQIVEQTSEKVQMIILYSIFILLFLVCAIGFTLINPKGLKHPAFLLSGLLACLFVYMITTNYMPVQEADDNLRYFYLVLENISSPN